MNKSTVTTADPQDRPATSRAANSPGAAPTSAARGSLVAGLQRLSQWVHVHSWRHWAKRRVSATQVKILELLSARREGLSVTGMAQALGITAATVCDCVNALKNKGLLTKERCPQDARVQRVRLTAKGLAVAREVALADPLEQVFECLSPYERQSLTVLWMKMIYALEVSGQLAPSPMCAGCKYFRPFNEPDSRTPHRCAQAQVPLAESELRLDCAVFEAGDAQTQPAVWEAFLNGPVKVSNAHELLEHREPHSPSLSEGQALGEPVTAGS